MQILLFQVWIDLLRVMAIKLPSISNLESYGALYSQDPEQDFFSNIIHLQVMLSVVDCFLVNVGCYCWLKYALSETCNCSF